MQHCSVGCATSSSDSVKLVNLHTNCVQRSFFQVEMASLLLVLWYYTIISCSCTKFAAYTRPHQSYLTLCHPQCWCKEVQSCSEIPPHLAVGLVSVLHQPEQRKQSTIVDTARYNCTFIIPHPHNNQLLQNHVVFNLVSPWAGCAEQKHRVVAKGILCIDAQM